MESMRKVARLTDEEDKGKELLDAELWGQLQEHIPLQCIYEKLLQRDLFRVRLVSKEWNHAALQWILPKPSFVTIAESASEDYGVNLYLNGIVTYYSVSGKFKFNRQHLRLLHVEDHIPPFEVEGLILCHNPDDLEERGVFNVHTRTWHAIPVGPEQSERECLFACGLLVDTTVKPYTFKLIEGNRHFRTQIYDSKSRSWSKTSSRLPSSTMVPRGDVEDISCVCHNDNVYIYENKCMIWKYSLEDDKWSVITFAHLRVCEGYQDADGTLGVWEGRIFTTRENDKKQRLSVWELVDFEGQKWVEYARMPKELFEWLRKCDYGFRGRSQDLFLRSFFRDGYLLVGSLRFKGACVNVFVLFKLATKIWRKVDLPRGTVAVDEHELERDDEGKDVEGAEDVDEADYFDELDNIDFHENDDEDDDTDEEDDVDEDDDTDEEDGVDEDDEVDE